MPLPPTTSANHPPPDPSNDHHDPTQQSDNADRILVQIQQSLPPGITLVSADDLKQWEMDIRVLDPNPLYLNQTFRARFTFSNNYPIGSAPSYPFPIPIRSCPKTTSSAPAAHQTNDPTQNPPKSSSCAFPLLTAPHPRRPPRPPPTARH